MVFAPDHNLKKPLELIVTGEAESYLPALGKIVGPRWLHTRPVASDVELLDVVRSGKADAAVLDDASDQLDALRLLRLIRRLDAALPVVVVTDHTERQWLEAALELTAHSVVVKPLELEQLLRQIHGIMVQVSRILHRKTL